MSSTWSDKIRKVTPYVPGEQPKDTNIIKLNTNENPYPPSPEVAKELKNINVDRLRLYPDPESFELASTIADCYGLDTSEVFVGNGSDEVLALSFLTFFNSDKEILFPNISYSFYQVYADLYGIKYRKIPLDENFKVNKEDYMIPNGGIVIANPNAPTSIAMSLDAIEDIIKANRYSVVIIDEAYVDFGADSAVKLINKYDNLLVVHTFSKSRSLAGIRLGYALGSKELITYLKGIKNSFNSYPIDYISQVLATAAMKDIAYYKKVNDKVIKTREYLSAELKKSGFFVSDSSTNFLFVTHPILSARSLFEYLKENNIYVRYFNSPLIDNHLRITIGTDEEIDVLLKFITYFMELKKI